MKHLTLIVFALLFVVAPLRAACPPDLNRDGVTDNGDLVLFVDRFLASDPVADFSGDGTIDNSDIGAFVTQFLAGCETTNGKGRTMASGGWHSNDATSNDGVYAALDLGDPPTIIQTAASNTLLIPFYYIDRGWNAAWLFNIYNVYEGTTSRERMTFKPGTRQLAVSSTRLDTGGQIPISTPVLTAAPDGTHYMIAYTYDHATGTHNLYLYEEGSATKIGHAVISSPIWVKQNRAATDIFSIGSAVTNNTGVNNIPTWPMLGIVCRKGVMSEAEIDAVWAARTIRSLYPASVSDLAYTVGMHGGTHLYSGSTLKVYQPNVQSDNTLNRIQYWDESDGTDPSAFSAAMVTPVDLRSVNSGGSLTNGDITEASFLDPDAPEGGFWTPGQPTAAQPTTTIAGSLPNLLAVINGTRTGTRPMMLASLGNSRTSNLPSGPVDDAGPTHGLRSLAYGFARARPERYAGYALCATDVNTNAVVDQVDKYTLGSPPGSTNIITPETARWNKNRYGFGSSTTGGTDGPGQTYSLEAGDALELRFDTRDPVDGSTHPTQPFAVLARRPGAGLAVCQSTKKGSRDSAAGTLVGSSSTVNLGSTINLDTTEKSGTLLFQVLSGDTTFQTLLAMSEADVGKLVQFDEDDDVVEIAGVVFDDPGYTVTLKHPVIGTKAASSTVRVGPLGYEYIGPAAIDEIPEPDASNYMRGVTVLNSANCEVISIGFYYTDLPSGVCPIIMGWGGNGEGTQVAASVTNAMPLFIDAVGCEGVILNYATQGITNLQTHIEDRLGDQVDQVEIIGAAEGAYTSSSFFADEEFATAVIGARAFAAAHSKTAFYSIYEMGYDFVSASYAGWMENGAHQTPRGSVGRNDLLWDAIEADLGSITPTGDGTAITGAGSGSGPGMSADIGGSTPGLR